MSGGAALSPRVTAGLASAPGLWALESAGHGASPPLAVRQLLLRLGGRAPRNPRQASLSAGGVPALAPEFRLGAGRQGDPHSGHEAGRGTAGDRGDTLKDEHEERGGQEAKQLGEQGCGWWHPPLCLRLPSAMSPGPEASSLGQGPCTPPSLRGLQGFIQRGVPQAGSPCSGEAGGIQAGLPPAPLSTPWAP